MTDSAPGGRDSRAHSPQLAPVRAPVLSQLSHFLYAADECEDLMGYKTHGYHPIILGEVLPKPRTCVSDENMEPRYRVMLKLGYGSFATVWLARDLVEEQYVALKVRNGSDSPTFSTEERILRWARDHQEHGQERILKLYDSFIVRGPNGNHNCLVTEVVAPIHQSPIWGLSDPKFTIQFMEGFAYLHSQGIAHGDPHIGNLGMALPQLNNFTEDEILDYFANPEVTPIIPLDPGFPKDTIPVYHTPSAEITEFLVSKKAISNTIEANVKILDFGRSYWTNDTVPNLQGDVPGYIRPPEVEIFRRSMGKAGSAWSRAADVWALGLSLCELKIGYPFLTGWGDILPSVIQIGGAPPKSWPKLCTDKDKWLLEVNKDQVWSDKIGRFSRSRKAPADLGAFVHAVKLMIVTDPEDRCSMEEVLNVISH